MAAIKSRQELNDLFQAPHVIGNARLHRWRDSEALVDAAETLATLRRGDDGGTVDEVGRGDVEGGDLIRVGHARLRGAVRVTGGALPDLVNQVEGTDSAVRLLRARDQESPARCPIPFSNSSPRSRARRLGGQSAGAAGAVTSCGPICWTAAR